MEESNSSSPSPGGTWHLSCLDISTYRDISNHESLISSSSAEQVSLIDLSHNRLLSLASFPSFPNLLELNLSGNRLASLPVADFPVLDFLKKLDLSYNVLTGFPGLSLVRSLDNLNLKGNRLRSLADFQVLFHSGVSGLTELDLSGNLLDDLRQLCFLHKFHKIRKVSFVQNPLCRSPLYKTAVLQSIDAVVTLDGKPVTLAERHQAKITPMVFTRNLEISPDRFSIDQNLNCAIVGEVSRPAGLLGGEAADRPPLEVIADAVPAASAAAAAAERTTLEMSSRLEQLVEASETRELGMLRKIEKQEKQISDLHLGMKGLQKENENQRIVIDKAHAEKDQLRKDFRLIDDAIDKKERKFLQQISDQEKCIAQLETEMGSLRVAVRDYEKDNKELSILAGTLKAEISDHQLRRNEAVGRASELAVLLERKTGEFTQIQSELKTQDAKYTQELETLRAAHAAREEDLKKRLDEKSRSAIDALEKLEVENQNLTLERNRLMSENGIISDTLRSTCSALKTAAGENSSLTESNRSLSALNASLQTQTAKAAENQQLLERACKEELGTMLKRVKMAELLSREAREEASVAVKESDRFRLENSRLSEDCAQRVSDLAASESARRAAVEEVTSQTELLKILRKSEDVLLKEVVELRDTCKALQDRDRKSQDNFADLRTAFLQVETELEEFKRRSESEILALRRDRDKTAVEMANREALLGHLKEQVDQSVAECQRVEDDKTLIAERLKTSESVISYVQEEMEDLRLEFQRQRAEIADKDSEVASAKTQVDSLNMKISDLEASARQQADQCGKLEREIKQRDEEMKILILAVEKEKKAVDDKMRKVKELFAV